MRRPPGDAQQGRATPGGSLSQAGPTLATPARSVPGREVSCPHGLMAWNLILGPAWQARPGYLPPRLKKEALPSRAGSSHGRKIFPPSHVSSPSSWLHLPDVNSKNREENRARRRAPSALSSLPLELREGTLGLPEFISEASADFGFSAVAVSCPVSPLPRVRAASLCL